MQESDSFASHPKASRWSKKNKVKPNEVSLYYYKKFWFDCDKCNHDFETNLNSVARLASWCPYCANKVLCSNESCQECFNKSFASHERANNWSSKNKLTARNVYKNHSKKIWFQCFDCDKDFESTPNNITGGKWCKSCGYKSSKEKQLMKFSEFLSKAKETHNDIYDYSKVIMNGVDIPVTIICKIHGEFNQTPYNHYTQGNGCMACGIISRGEKKRFTIEEFVSRANQTHDNKYDYSKVDYIDSQTPIIIGCKLHGDFTQAPNSHLQGNGCKKCGEISSHNKQRLTIDDFISRAKSVHGDIYDYSKSDYVSGHVPIKIKCKIHGDFEIDPYNHLKGYGCSLCTGAGVSKAQIEWLKYIEETSGKDIIYKGGKYNREESFRFASKLYRVDGFCKETNTVYEFLGCWFHGCPDCQDEDLVHCWYKKTMKQLYEEFIIRKKVFEENGFNIEYIWECKWKNIRNIT